MMMQAMLRHPVRFMRDHRYTRAHASDYLDGDLDARGRRRVDEHTGMCPSCRHLIESLRRTVEGLMGLRTDPDGHVAEDVIRRLRDEP
jgi:predicted anti-sigma-YlaC factor YlaD